MKKAIRIINILLDDCESQYNALDSYDDVCWDCYDMNNWENMVEHLKDLKKLITNVETHENTTKTTRECGKEL